MGGAQGDPLREGKCPMGSCVDPGTGRTQVEELVTSESWRPCRALGSDPAGNRAVASGKKGSMSLKLFYSPEIISSK